MDDRTRLLLVVTGSATIAYLAYRLLGSDHTKESGRSLEGNSVNRIDRLARAAAKKIEKASDYYRPGLSKDKIQIDEDDITSLFKGFLSAGGDMKRMWKRHGFLPLYGVSTSLGDPRIEFPKRGTLKSAADREKAFHTYGKSWAKIQRLTKALEEENPYYKDLDDHRLTLILLSLLPSSVPGKFSGEARKLIGDLRDSGEGGAALVRALVDSSTSKYDSKKIDIERIKWLAKKPPKYISCVFTLSNGRLYDNPSIDKSCHYIAVNGYRDPQVLGIEHRVSMRRADIKENSYLGDTAVDLLARVSSEVCERDSFCEKLFPDNDFEKGKYDERMSYVKAAKVVNAGLVRPSKKPKVEMFLARKLEDRDFLEKTLLSIADKLREFQATLGSLPYIRDNLSSSDESTNQIYAATRSPERMAELLLKRTVSDLSKIRTSTSSDVGRAKDRKAQKDPVWAISECPTAYAAGVSVGPKIEPALLFLSKKANRSKFPVFIHGRDGELIGELLKRMGVRTYYGITSRAITTELLDKEAVDTVKKYVSRVCPKAAIHFDTGYSGSIPKWFSEQGFDVREIWMLNSRDRGMTIPGMTMEHEDIVEQIEHTHKRLVSPKIQEGKIKLLYDARPECFWSTLYGVADSLNLPRKI